MRKFKKKNVGLLSDTLYYHRHIHRRNEVLNCIAQGQNNRIKQC